MSLLGRTALFFDHVVNQLLPHPRRPWDGLRRSRALITSSVITSTCDVALGTDFTCSRSSCQSALSHPRRFFDWLRYCLSPRLLTSDVLRVLHVLRKLSARASAVFGCATALFSFVLCAAASVVSVVFLWSFFVISWYLFSNVDSSFPTFCPFVFGCSAVAVSSLSLFVSWVSYLSWMYESRM